MSSSMVITPPALHLFEMTPDANQAQSDLTACLAHLCLETQKELDLSPQLLNKLLNDEIFSQGAIFLSQQCYTLFHHQLNAFKISFSNLTQQNPLPEMAPGEYEKCGRVIKLHTNSYIEYCNQHKYMHPHSDLLRHDDTINHQFVIKDSSQILHECFQYQVYGLYHMYINKLFNYLRTLFYYQMRQQCEMTNLAIDRHQEMNQYLEQMGKNPHLGKSKAIYEHLMQEPNPDDPQEIKTNSIYYIKLINYRGSLDVTASAST